MTSRSSARVRTDRPDTGSVRRTVLLLLVVAAAASACVGHGAVDTTGTGNGSNYNATGSAYSLISDRRPAPVLSGRTLAGRTLSTSAYRGKVLVLNFWASWCPPCRAESPVLENAATAFASRGVAMLGVDFRDSTDNARAFDAANGVTYPSLVDFAGQDMVPFGRYGFVTIPDTVVLDRAGRVAARFIGPVDGAALSGVLTRLAAEPAA